MTDIRHELHEALDQPDFPGPALVKQAMAQLDEPQRGGPHAWQVVVAAILVVALVATFLLIRFHRGEFNPAGNTGWHSADLPGTHSGFRAAAYDPTRDCLWIITKQPPLVAGGVDTVVLTRLNAADRSASPTPLSMPATGYLTGSVAVDGGGKVWMSWGRLLIEYDPDSKAIQSFKFPVQSTVSRASSARLAVVHPQDSYSDSNSVAMAISPDQEIWVLVSSVQAAFGFNPATGSWDRMVRVPLDPVDFWSRLVAAGPGKLVMSGVVFVRGEGVPYLAVVDTASETSLVLPPKVAGFGLIDNDTAVYAELTGTIGEFNLGKVDLSNGSTTFLTSKAPIEVAAFATDPAGQVWFSMVGYWTVGIARVDPSTGTVKEFPFAFVQHPGTPEPVVSSCPTPRSSMDRCFPQYKDPSALFGNPEVEQIVVDKKGNIWVITSVAAAGDPNANGDGPLTPVYELTAGS